MKFDMNNRHQQLIIVGLSGLVEDEGLTAHEAFEVLEDIKRATFFALRDIEKEGSENE